MRDKAEQAAVGLSGLRIATGLLLTWAAWNGLSPASPTGPELAAAIESALPARGEAWSWWARTVLLDNPEAVAVLWRWSLLFVGLGLTLGALTRPAGLVGAVLMVHAWAFGNPDLAGHHLLVGVGCLVFAAARAGRILGLDGALDPLLPAWVTFTPEQRRRY